MSGTSVMVPRHTRGRARGLPGAVSPYRLVGLGVGTDLNLLHFNKFCHSGSHLDRWPFPAAGPGLFALTSEPASTSTKHGGQVHFTGPGSQQKA